MTEKKKMMEKKKIKITQEKIKKSKKIIEEQTIEMNGISNKQ